MENQKNFAEMIDFQKFLFDNSFKMMSLFQNQSEKIIQFSIDQNPWFPEDGKKICSYWTQSSQKYMKNCKEVMATNFNKIKEMMSPPEKPEKAKEV